MEYLSKSKYCKGMQCPKILWLDKYNSEVAVDTAKQSVFENGRKVGELARKLFGKFINIEYDKDLNVMIANTQIALESGAKIITEASFNYNNNFCSVDILRLTDNGVEIYEVKSSSHIEQIYVEDVTYQCYILTNLGYNVEKVSIVYLNRKYIRGEELELDKLFIIEDITDIALEKQLEVEKNIELINQVMEENKADSEPNIDISKNCTEPYLCKYWQYCTKDLPKPNVFDLSILGNKSKDIKFEKYYEGKVSFKDLQNEDLQERALEQINFEINNLEPKIDKEAIRGILDSLKYPLYFIDYESYNTPIPEIIGTKPYQQLPFQYSLHIIKEEGAPVEHKEFLADCDDKDFIRHFAESMIKDMPENGSIIIYSKAFEPARNREIANLYPDLKDELERMNKNMVDFLEPFKKRIYYCKEMNGSASIKAVLPALYPDNPDLDYHNLSVVHNGDEASEAFLSLKGKTKEEQEEIRNGLLVYCELDTYAMVKVWEKLKEVVEE